MRITFILTQSLDSPGGTGRFFPLAKSLTQLGHEVTLLALHHDYHNAEQCVFDRDGVHVRYVAQMHVRKVGNQKYYYPPLVMLWIALVATLKLAWWAMRIPVDAIQVCKSQPMNALAAWWVHLWKHVPVFIDSDDYEAASNRFATSWQQHIVGWFEDWMASYATGMIAGNMFIANRYSDLGFPEDRMIVLPNGVDQERFTILDEFRTPQVINDLRTQLGIRDTDRVLIYVGSMSGTDHPVDMLLDAFTAVSKQIPDALLVLVGSGEDYEYFRQYATELGIASRTIFVGRVSPEEVPYYYALGELSIDPRRDTLASQSSLSLKLVESIAAGVPCITTDIGDRATILDGAGIAVLPNNTQALEAGILSALLNMDVYQCIHARATAIRHTIYWRHRADQLNTFYKALLDERLMKD